MKKNTSRVSVLNRLFPFLTNRFNSIKSRVKEIKKDKEERFFHAGLGPKVDDTNKTVVELSPLSMAKSAVVVILVVLTLFFLYQINGILLVFFFSFLLAAALDPLVHSLEDKVGIPRALGVTLIYLVLFVLVGLFVTNVATLLATQIYEIAVNVGQFVANLTREGNSQFPFANELRPYLNQFYQTIDLQAAASQVQNALQFISNQLLSISFGLFNVILVLILTFFMSVEERAIEQFFLSLFPSKYAKYVTTRLEAVKDQIGQWLRGQLLVSVIAAFLTYVGLMILGVKYALTLSFIAGILMVIPVIGRIIAWILTFPIVFNQSPMLSLWMTIYYFVLMQLENNVINPFVMNRVVGLSPIIIIFAMMVGGQYLGVMGWILAIPLATIVTIFINDYTAKEK